MDEIELYETTDKIIQGFVWLSKKNDNNVDAQTLAQHYKRTKDERTSKDFTCDYLKVEDSAFYNSNQVSKRYVIKRKGEEMVGTRNIVFLNKPLIF